jgi:hypothetical protein
MEKINNEFPIESDIQVNQNELKLYTKILSNHNKIIIRINDNINEIYTKSYYKIMSLGFLYPEENILFTLNEDEEKDDNDNKNDFNNIEKEFKISYGSNPLDYYKNDEKNNNFEMGIFNKIQQGFLTEKDNSRIYYYFYKYSYYFYGIFGIFLSLHFALFFLSDYFCINFYLITLLILIVCLFYLSYIGIFKYNGVENSYNSVNSEEMTKLIYKLIILNSILTLLNLIIINMKKLKGENLTNYIQGKLFLLNLFYIFLLAGELFALYNFSKINDIYYTSLNVEMERLISKNSIQ